MASFTAGTTFVDGVANDVTAAKLGALVTAALPTSGLIQDRTAETVVATNDTFLIGDASDSNTLKRMTVANVMKAEHTGTINTTAGTIQTLTASTATITTGTVATLNSTIGTVATLNSTTGTITNLNSTTGTVATLNSTTGTITGLNSTTGTVATLNSTTATIPTLTSITKITSGTGTAAAPAISPTGDTNTGVFFPAADTIAFAEGGSEAMRIDSDGDVGIGVTSPTEILQVATNKNIAVGTYAYFGNLYSSQGAFLGYNAKADTTSNVLQQVVVANSAASVGYGFIRVGIGSAAGSMSFHTTAGTVTAGDVITSSNERMRIDSSGNVGIGTSAPTSMLHMSKAGAAFPSTSNPRIRLDETTSGRFGIIEFDSDANLNFWGSGSASGDIRFLTSGGSGTERMRIAFGGNVGIGTASAVNKLEVFGSFGRGAPATKTTDFTLGLTENWIIVNKITTSCTATLPAASSWTGREFTIKTLQALTVVSASANVVPINGTAAGTAILPATSGSWATLVSDGTNWVIMAS